jgi:hypothetical protein
LAALTIAAVVIAPSAWYLGSPLFLSSTLNEPAPRAAAAVSPSSTPTQAPRSSGTSRPVATSTAAAAAPTAVPPSPTPRPIERRGRFSGADEFHFGKGTARLIETAPGRFTVRLEDFAVRNGPDLYLYLSPSAEGYARGAVELGRLKADRGDQNYRVPAGTDVTRAASVVVWCRQFSVLFATATLG